MGDLTLRQARLLDKWAKGALSQGYSPEDVEKTLKEGGYGGMDQVQKTLNPDLSMGGKALDAAESGGVGVVKGTAGMLGAPKDIGQGLGSLLTGLIDKHLLGKSDEDIAATRKKAQERLDNAPLAAPGANDILRNIESLFGKMHDPQTVAGEYAQSIGEMVPAVAGGPASIGKKAASAVLGGSLAETGGRAFEGTKAEPWARAIGAGGGALLPDALSFLIKKAAPSALMPPKSDAARQLEKLDVGPSDVAAQTSTSGKPLLPADLSERAAELAKKATSRTESPDVARRVFTDRNAPGMAADDMTQMISTRGAGNVNEAKDIADQAFASFRQSAPVSNTSALFQELNVPIVRRAVQRVANTMKGTTADDILKMPSIPTEVMEKIRLELRGMEQNDLAQNLVKTAQNSDWENAINASQESIRATNASQKAPSLLNPKMNDEQLVGKLVDATGETDLNTLAPLIDKMRENQAISRTNQAVSEGGPKLPSEYDAGGTFAAVSAGMPKKSVFEMLMSVTEGTEKHKRKVAASLLEALSDPASEIWKQMAKMKVNKVSKPGIAAAASGQYQEGRRP